jgi:hypothetical protein
MYKLLHEKDRFFHGWDDLIKLSSPPIYSDVLPVQELHISTQLQTMMMMMMMMMMINSVF